MAREMKRQGCPVTLFLNGASGNVHTNHPLTGEDASMDEAGEALARDALEVLGNMEYREHRPLGAVSETVSLPYRELSEDEIAGTVKGAQRFVDPSAYDGEMPGLVERIRERKTQPAEVQVLFLGDLAVAGIPAEYFVEHGLRIKEEAYPAHAIVVGQANGMVGYVPTRGAFERGGYETTFRMGSRLAPEAGDILADTAIRLIRSKNSE